MSQPTTPMYAGEAYAPTQTDELLWWLATAEKELIKDCVVDRNRYRIVGMSVLATWIFATLAWTYFFSTVIDNVFLYVGSGAFMGFGHHHVDQQWQSNFLLFSITESQNRVGHACAGNTWKHARGQAVCGHTGQLF